MNLLTVGTQAPTFSLPDQQGTLVSLMDFISQPVVLYFYPKAMTPGCTTQACGLRDRQADFQQRNTVVLGISPDPVDKLARFIEQKALNFTLLSDQDHRIAEQYGAWGEKSFMGKRFMGILRSTFIIDQQGKIVAVIDKVKTKTHHDDVIHLLDQCLAQ